jgi:hypothetical protein
VAQVGVARTVVEVEPLMRLLMLALRWVGNPLWLLALVLLLTRWVGGTVVVHRLVPGRSTAGWSCYDLPLL